MLASENGAALIMWFEVFFHHSLMFQLAVSMLFLEAGGVAVKFPLAEDELNAFSIYFGIYVSYCVSTFIPSSSICIKKKNQKQQAHFRISGFHSENCK